MYFCADPTTENAVLGVQPMPWVPQPAPAPAPAILLIPPEGSIKQTMVELKEGTIQPLVEKLATLHVKSKLKESKDGSAVLKTGGKVSQHKLANNFSKKKSFTIHWNKLFNAPSKFCFHVSPLSLLLYTKLKSLVIRSVIVMCGSEQGTSNGLVPQSVDTK